MSNNEIIRLEGVSKRYRLGVNHSYKTMAEKLTSLFMSSQEQDEVENKEIWAVRDVDLTVTPGEALGIIGRNGSGKSTLLKLLTRITQPTKGRITYSGRIGALLEVGTGFHPELTGRENIMMNGLILGMSRHEIKRKLDAIVDFSGVEKFLETPVKRYSSGMRVRLGFAIAAHLDPEILIVDEVLAVGDAQFQARCLGRMNEVANEGRTVIFVSHQLESVISLCRRTIWLDQGAIRADGEPEQIVSDYLAHTRKQVAQTDIAQRTDRRGEGGIVISKIEVFDNSGVESNAFGVGDSMDLKFHYKSLESHLNVDFRLKIAIRNHHGHLITQLSNEYVGAIFERVDPCGCLNICVPKISLTPGIYSIDFTVRLNGILMDQVKDVKFFEVIAKDYFGAGRVVTTAGAAVFIDQKWELEA